MTVEQHLQQMMREADDLNGTMNNSGFYYLGHLTYDERARVSLAFAAMVMDYARRHDLDVKSPVREISK